MTQENATPETDPRPRALVLEELHSSRQPRNMKGNGQSIQVYEKGLIMRSSHRARRKVEIDSHAENTRTTRTDTQKPDPGYRLTRCSLCGTVVVGILHMTVVKDSDGSWRLKCPRCG